MRNTQQLVDQALPLSFRAPDGHTPERHVELMGLRHHYGLPDKTSWGAGQVPAVAFELRNTYGRMHSNDTKYKEPRLAIRQMANLLMRSHDQHNGEHLVVRSHPHSVTIAAPIVVVGERGVDEAWVRGFQVARVFQQMLNVNRECGESGVSISHYMLPGTTRDGYLTAYPALNKLPGSTSYAPRAGDLLQTEAPTWLQQGYVAMRGDRMRERGLEVAAQAAKSALKP